MFKVRLAVLAVLAWCVAVLAAPGAEPIAPPARQDEAIPKLTPRFPDAPLKHGNMIIAVVYAPDGTALASGGWDKLVRTWDAATGKELRQFTGHEGAIYGVAYSPDGRLIASGSEDKTVRLWDAATGKEHLKMVGHQGGVTKVIFAPDGKTLASGSYDQTIRYWDVQTGNELRKLGGQQRGFTTIAFSPDGRFLASGCGENLVCLWEVSSGKEYRRLQGHAGAVVGVAFSPDGRLLATSSEDRSVRIWEVRSGKECRLLSGHSAGVWAVAFSPDGRLLATAGRDTTVRLWEVISGKPVRQAQGHKQGIPALAFAPDGKSMASGSHDASGVIWDLAGVNRSPDGRPVSFSPKELAELWTNLADGGAVKARDAIWQLAAAPQQAVSLVESHLRPVPPVDPQHLQQLIEDLDDNQFLARQHASEELEKLGEVAGPILEQTLRRPTNLEVQQRVERLLEKLSGPVSSPETLRAARAVEVLEKVATPEARKLLGALAKGASGAQLTEEAKAALARLGK